MSAEEVAAGMSEEGFKFKENSDNDFVVYVSKNGPKNDAFVSVTTEIDHGWVSNGASVKKGDDFEVTWRPGNGYVVKSVTVTEQLFILPTMIPILQTGNMC